MCIHMYVCIYIYIGSYKVTTKKERNYNGDCKQVWIWIGSDAPNQTARWPRSSCKPCAPWNWALGKDESPERRDRQELALDTGAPADGSISKFVCRVRGLG